MLAPVMRKTRMIAPRVAPMVRRMAMSLALVLHQHDQAGNDVERRHQHDHRQDDEHDVALDLERGEEDLIALPPIVMIDRPPAASTILRRKRSMLSGSSTIDLDRGARRRRWLK